MTQTIPPDLYATRRDRLARLADGYDAPDVEGVGTEHIRRPATPLDQLQDVNTGRYVLVTASATPWYSLRVYDTTEDVEQAAAEAILTGDSYRPVCYFDLDELAGEPPELDWGDQIRYRGNALTVVAAEYDPTNGRRQLVVDLDPDADADDPTVIRLDERGDSYEIVSRTVADDRTPVRYAVAKIAATVAFNTEPSPA